MDSENHLTELKNYLIGALLGGLFGITVCLWRSLSLLKLNLNRAGYIYLPKELREMFGIGDIEALVNAKTLVIYKAGEDLDSITKSLGVIQQDIELRRETTVLKLMPSVEIEDVGDKLNFKKGDRSIAVLKSSISNMLKTHSPEELSQILRNKLSEKGFDIELDRIRTILSKVEFVKE